jgi:transposase
MQLQRYSLASLEEEYKQERDARVRERLQIILFLREKENYREISSRLRITIGLITYWKKRFEKEGTKGLEDKKGRGRKSELDEKQLRELSSTIDKGIRMKDGYKRGYNTKDVRSLIQNKFGRDYTTRNCLKILSKLGYNLKVPRPRNKKRNQNDVDEFKEQFKKNFLVWKKKQ